MQFRGRRFDRRTAPAEMLRHRRLIKDGPGRYHVHGRNGARYDQVATVDGGMTCTCPATAGCWHAVKALRAELRELRRVA